MPLILIGCSSICAVCPSDLISSEKWKQMIIFLKKFFWCLAVKKKRKILVPLKLVAVWMRSSFWPSSLLLSSKATRGAANAFFVSGHACTFIHGCRRWKRGLTAEIDGTIAKELKRKVSLMGRTLFSMLFVVLKMTFIIIIILAKQKN